MGGREGGKERERERERERGRGGEGKLGARQIYEGERCHRDRGERGDTDTGGGGGGGRGVHGSRFTIRSSRFTVHDLLREREGREGGMEGEKEGKREGEKQREREGRKDREREIDRHRERRRRGRARGERDI